MQLHAVGLAVAVVLLWLVIGLFLVRRWETVPLRFRALYLAALSMALTQLTTSVHLGLGIAANVFRGVTIVMLLFYLRLLRRHLREEDAKRELEDQEDDQGD